MRFEPLIFGAVLALIACGQTSAQTASPLAAVTQRPVLSAFSSGGNPADVRVESVPVNGQPFKTAWRVTGLRALEQPYSAQLSAPNAAAIAKSDVLLAHFWARSTGGKAAQTEFVFEEGGPNYAKSVSAGVRLTPDWTLYELPFTALRAYAPGEGTAHFRLGYVGQSFELADIQLSNFARTRSLGSLPTRGFDYAGREAGAAWRAQAAARIEKLRKGDLQLRVLDSAGKPVTGATVRIEMTRHAFPFGSAVDGQKLLNDAKYRNKFFELFNRAVLENDLKWPGWECCRATSLKALDLLRAGGVDVRGHNLIWPCDDDDCLPQDVAGFISSKNAPALKARIDAHLKDEVGATRGKIAEWDVVNEPSANKRLARVLGEDEMAAWFGRVKALDPAARLFLNDYGNLGEGNLDAEYKRIITRLLALGAPVQGIGLQAHFGMSLTPPAELMTRLDSFGQFGLPLAITEFDVNIPDEQLQADYLRDALTVAFSNPHVSSFLMWGFWEGQHWLPQAALYRLDWRIKPNGRVWNDLVYGQWWTRAVGQTDRTGKYVTRGFLGDYTVTVSKNGKVVKQTLGLAKGGSVSVVRLP